MIDHLNVEITSLILIFEFIYNCKKVYSAQKVFNKSILPFNPLYNCICEDRTDPYRLGEVSKLYTNSITISIVVKFIYFSQQV